jgi:hypothetical protein
VFGLSCFFSPVRDCQLPVLALRLDFQSPGPILFPQNREADAYILVKKDHFMQPNIERRRFIQLAIGGAFLCVGGLPGFVAGQSLPEPKLISPGCRRSKVRVARLYLGVPKSHYPNPALDLAVERRNYEAQFSKLTDQLTDVDFVVDQMISQPEQVKALKDQLLEADGILAIHLTYWVLPVMKEVLALGRPTIIFAIPYSGHEWYDLSAIRRQELGKRMECILTTDYTQLAAAIRPFRAIHHLREAKILNLAAHSPADYGAAVNAKFGAEIKQGVRQNSSVRLLRAGRHCRRLSD